MSRFVTAGGEEAKPSTDPAREDAWAKAQAAIEASRTKPKSLQDGKQDGGKSLYEVLQANKAQKEQAFEEASKLKNQFRSLDDDEIGFLDEVQEKERLKEAQARKETAEELQAFRKHQAEAERKANVTEKNDNSQTSKDTPDTTWQTKKRRRKDGDGAAPKIRKMSTGDKSPDPPVETVTKKSAAEDFTSNTDAKATSPSTNASNGLGLGAYDDSDDD